jgi:hypothetical protein
LFHKGSNQATKKPAKIFHGSVSRLSRLSRLSKFIQKNEEESYRVVETVMTIYEKGKIIAFAKKRRRVFIT